MKLILISGKTFLILENHTVCLLQLRRKIICIHIKFTHEFYMDTTVGKSYSMFTPMKEERLCRHIKFTHEFSMDTNEVGACKPIRGRLFLVLL
jgi:hypothetical protein